jgi:hypothetical protein
MKRRLFGNLEQQAFFKECFTLLSSDTAHEIHKNQIDNHLHKMPLQSKGWLG